MYGIGKNATHFLLFNFYHFSSHKQLDTQTCFYDEIANHVEINWVVINGTW